MTEKRKANVGFIHVVIIFTLMFGFKYIPPIGTISPLGMQVIGIFAGIIYGWTTMGMIWPSLLGIFALGLLPGNGMVDTFKAALGDRITVAVFMFLLFAGLIERVGLSSFIANWCISRKFVQGRPYAILAMFCLAGGLIAAFVNLFAGMILMWSVFYSFCKQVGFKMEDTFPRVALIAIIYISCMAGGILPFMGLSFLIIGQQFAFLGIPMNYICFTIMQLIMVLFAGVLYFGAAKFIIRPDVSRLQDTTAFSIETVKMTKPQKMVLFLLGILMLLLFLPGILPKAWAITEFLKALDIAAPVALVLVAYYIINLNNEEVVTFSEMAASVNWGLVLMFATVAPLSAAVANPESGILSYISVQLGAIFKGMNPYLFTIMIILIASVITQFANNVAIVLMVMPIMYTFAIQLGANPLVLSVLCVFNLNIAFCTPAASGAAAMIFSNREWIPPKDAYLHGFLIFVINMLVTIIALPIAEIFF